MVSRSNFTQPVSISVTNKQTKDDPLCNLQHTFTHNCGQFSANLLKAGFRFNTFSTNVFEGPTPQALLSKATIFPNLPSTLHFQDANWWDQHIHIRASLIKKTTQKHPLSEFSGFILCQITICSKCCASFTWISNSLALIFSPWGGRQILPFLPPSFHPSLPHPGSCGEAIIAANYLQIGPIWQTQPCTSASRVQESV